MSSVPVNGGFAPVFLDDSEQPDAQNGQPAAAGIIHREALLLNQVAHCGRPYYSWQWGEGLGIPGGSTTDLTSCHRQVYMAANKGAGSEGGEIFGLQHLELSFPGFQTGQGIDVTVGTSTGHAYWGYTTSPSLAVYPDNMKVLTPATSFGYSTKPCEVIVGGVTSNWPAPVGGTLWQNSDNAVDASKASYVGTADIVPTGDIIGVGGASQEQLTSLIDVFRDTWFHQRPQCGWSTVLPGLDPGFTGSANGVHFTTSVHAFRYIFDQSYGVGGTTITSTSPAMTLPLANASWGMSTQVRVYLFVYAAMSGATDAGTITIANKDATGTMTAPTFPVLAPIVSGTAFKWYPSLSTWAATTGSYFLGYTGGAFDRVALCGRSSGTTDHLIIGAFTFVVAPATS